MKGVKRLKPYPIYNCSQHAKMVWIWMKWEKSWVKFEAELLVQKQNRQLTKIYLIAPLRAIIWRGIRIK